MALALLAPLAPPVIPTLAAQEPTATLAGEVASLATRQPLDGALVVVVGTELVATTDPEGHFVIRRVPAGVRSLEIRFLGTVSDRLEVRLPAGERTEIRILLDLNPVPLAPIRVSVHALPPPGKLREFYERRGREHGYFLTREEIARRAPMETSDLFREIPGMRLDPSPPVGQELRAGRGHGCPIDYFLDGVPMPAFDVDDVRPEDIDGIEVYRGAAEVPPRFRRWGTCAVIVIWTRDPRHGER